MFTHFLSATLQGVPFNSLDFEASLSQSLSISNADWGSYNREKFAISGYLYRETDGVTQNILFKGTSSSNAEFAVYIDSSNRLVFYTYKGDGTNTNGNLISTTTIGAGGFVQFLLHYDSTNATPGNRMRMWINAVEETVFNTDVNPTEAAYTNTEDVVVGGGVSPLDGKLYQLTFYDDYLPSIGEVTDSGSPISVSGVEGIKSCLAGSGGDVTDDTVLTSNWTNNNGVSINASIPA
jgi:hypothetical protein